MLLQHMPDVFALEPSPRCRSVPRSAKPDRTAVQPHVRKDIVEADTFSTREAGHDRVEHRAQFHGGVGAPRQRPDQRQRRARQRLRRITAGAADLAQEIVRESGDVLATVSECGMSMWITDRRRNNSSRTRPSWTAASMPTSTAAMGGVSKPIRRARLGDDRFAVAQQPRETRSSTSSASPSNAPQSTQTKAAPPDWAA
jgi:hypothetical protein